MRKRKGRTMNKQRSDLIAAQRRVWGDCVQLCASCDREAKPFSCYCEACEEEQDRRAFEEEKIASRVRPSEY